MAERRCVVTLTRQTIDTYRAAAVFLDMLTIWPTALSSEHAAKSKYAKYHALRIAKALKAGEDPNLSNPVAELPSQSVPSATCPMEVDRDRTNGGVASRPSPYRPHVEEIRDEAADPSPTGLSPSSALPTTPSEYPPEVTGQPSFAAPQDISPVSLSAAESRKGSMESAMASSSPRAAYVPTFTGGSAAPRLSTAPLDSEQAAQTFHASPPPAPAVQDPSSFYATEAPQPAQQYPQPVPLVWPQQAAPVPQRRIPPSQIQSQSKPNFSPAQPCLPSQVPPPPPLVPSLGHAPFRADDDSIMAAQKHAKWAISALNFEDVDTAVKELRIALEALGAS